MMQDIDFGISTMFFKWLNENTSRTMVSVAILSAINWEEAKLFNVLYIWFIYAIVFDFRNPISVEKERNTHFINTVLPII